jgi:hypothetical protein
MLGYVLLCGMMLGADASLEILVLCLLYEETGNKAVVAL